MAKAGRGDRRGEAVRDDRRGDRAGEGVPKSSSSRTSSSSPGRHRGAARVLARAAAIMSTILGFDLRVKEAGGPEAKGVLAEGGNDRLRRRRDDRQGLEEADLIERFLEADFRRRVDREAVPQVPASAFRREGLQAARRPGAQGARRPAALQPARSSPFDEDQVGASGAAARTRAPTRMRSTRSSARSRDSPGVRRPGCRPPYCSAGSSGFALVLTVLYSFWQVVDFEVVHDWTLDNYRYFFSVDTYVRTFVATLGIGRGRDGPDARGGLAVRVLADPLRLAPLARRLLSSSSCRSSRATCCACTRGSGSSARTARSTASSRASASRTSPSRSSSSTGRPWCWCSSTSTSRSRCWRSTWRSSSSTGASSRRRWTSGATAFGAIRRMLLPQIRPGIATGVIFVSIPMLGEYVTPLLVGGTKGVMIGNLVANFFLGRVLARRGGGAADRGADRRRDPDRVPALARAWR